MLRVQSFVSRFSKKKQTEVTELEADRLIYLYDAFKQPENLEVCVRGGGGGGGGMGGGGGGGGDGW